MAITIRSQQHTTAANGEGTAFNVESRVGDVAVIVMSSQFQFNNESGIPVPDGWYANKTLTVGASNRGGYLAWRRITDPSQTQNLRWWRPLPSWTSRQNGSIFVLEGAQSITLGEWSVDIPAITGTDTFVTSQMHGASNVQANYWTADPGTILFTGADQVSTVASWSSLRIARTTATPTLEAGKPLPQAWATFTPVPTGAPVEGLRLTVWKDGIEQVPHKAGVMPYGCLTVDSLLAKDQFVVAHRGGSRSWPEHTQRAYTNAMAHGVDAIEFSAGRTKDGVWFGCHDRTLERLGGPATDVSQMTWAEVVNAMSGSPYMPCTFEWLIDTYGGDVVIIFDPKYSMGDFNSYMPMLEPYKDCVMLKSHGDAEWAFRQWKGHGFRTWAYTYASGSGEAWYQTMLASTNIDTYSMEWNADASIFNALVATGKPVTSHITATTAQIQTGKDRGCKGTMCSVPDLVLPIRV